MFSIRVNFDCVFFAVVVLFRPSREIFFMFCGNATVVVRVISLGCVFRLIVSGKGRFLSAVQTTKDSEFSLNLVEIYIIYGYD